MIIAKIDKGKEKEVEACGTLKEIASDCLTIIEIVYKQIQKTRPELAGLFKECITIGISHPDTPVWGTENRREREERSK